MTEGTGNMTMDKLIAAGVITIIVAMLLVGFSPPMVQNTTKKKYHIPSTSLPRVIVYLAIAFFVTLCLSYLPLAD